MLLSGIPNLTLEPRLTRLPESASMTSPVQAGSNPVNPVLSRIGVKQRAPEIAGALLVFALSVFAWRFWSQLPLPTTILLGLLLLVALAFVLRRPLLGLF